MTNQYHKILDDIDTARQEWQHSTKPFIIFHLNNIISTHKLNLTVSLCDQVSNLEAIVLKFEDVQSGLRYDNNHDAVKNGASHDITKNGGALIFDQRPNGEIMIGMSYPFINFSHKENDTKEDSFITVPPQKISESIIYKAVLDFISRINTWHRREYKPSID